jgi:hypothetical protein
MWRVLGWVLLAIVVALPASGQEVRGNISGTVRDAGGVLPGASVEVTNTDTDSTQHLTTNGSGYFEAPLLQPGNYQVTVSLEGYKKVTRSGVALGVAQQVSLPFELEIGAINETITVTAETPLLDTASVSSAQTFDAKMVEALPMISNMPIMLTRFAAGVNPTPTQTLVSQGFADGTTTAAGEVVGGVGSNTYSIDGATNSGTGRRLAASPNADMIEEMRVESSNFDASVGHGLGLQISMLTKAGTNQYRGTGNYQYWTNRLNALNPSQRATFSDTAKELYDSGRSHNAAWTLGGPVVIPKLFKGKKMFFFANYSYVNDFIPGKNQGTSTVPANEKHLNGDFSDLLTLPNPAQYQIYDPLTVHRDPNNPNRFIRDPFPNNMIPANRIVNPLYSLYRKMVPPPNQNFVENGTTPAANYYQGGQPDSPVSHLYAVRLDSNLSDADRTFVRFSGNTFLEGVNDWTYEVPEFAGLHSLDRSRYNWAVVGNWTHTTGRTVFDTQFASNRFFQGDLRERLHEYKPTDMGFPAYLDQFCAAQGDCMLPQVTIGTGVNVPVYQGISAARSSDDTATNYQGTFNVTRITSRHTLRGGIDGRLAQRQRGPGGNPSSLLTYTNEFTRQASDTAQLTPSNLGLTLAALMLGIPSTTTATIQPEINLRNHYFAAFGQDSWRLGDRVTVNYGLRVEWEDGIVEDDGRIIAGFDPNAPLAISSAVQAAYARNPLPQLPAAGFQVAGGPIYQNASNVGATWKPETMLMPRASLAYKITDKTVLKAGYGMYFDTLNAADYTHNSTGFASTTINTNSTDFGQTFTLGNPYAGILANADPFPVRAGVRFIQPVDDTLGADTTIGTAQTLRFNEKHARQQRARVAIQREVFANTSIEVSYDYIYSDRAPVDIRADYLPAQYWIPGSLNARDAAAQAALDANVVNPYNLANLSGLATSDPTLYNWIATNGFFTATTVPRNRLLRQFSQYSTGTGLIFAEQPLGEAKVRALQINGTRRFANGFTANVALAFTHSENTRTVEEYDREPTLWVLNNNSRPWRISGGAVYELPFGKGKPWLNGSGVVPALAGGWNVAGTFEAQPGGLIMFPTNLFFYGDRKQIKKDKPEIALAADGKIDPSKYWFNVAGFETNAARIPTTFQTRAFPFYIDDLRGPGVQYANMNVTRTFAVGGRRTIQTRLDIQNLFNYAGYSNPVTDPTNTNFGKVVAAASAAGAMRFFSFGVRYAF